MFVIKKNFNRKRLTQTIASMVITFGIASSVSAGVAFNTNNGWEVEIAGFIPVFFVSSDHDEAVDDDNTDESASRIMSGFNPANLNFHIAAPTTDTGLTVSGHFQYDTHLQGSGKQNSGSFESRVAHIKIAGDFGAIIAGKDFGVFNSSAIGDLASQRGVGWLGGGADSADATGGRIGTGYVYANFNPQIKYISPNMGGLVFKIAVINPEEPQDTGIESETDTLRFEGQVDYAMTFDGGGFKLWSGVLFQRVDIKETSTTASFDYDMEGYDIGAHIDLANVGLTLSYTDTTGIGADGGYGGSIQDAEIDATQWYIEADYTFGKTTLGASYGEGEQDSRAADTRIGLNAANEVSNELGMLFAHYQMTTALRLIGEVQNYKSDAQADYDALVLGFQFDF